MQQTERINPFPTRCVLKLNTALLVRVAVMVYFNVPNRATAKLSSALTQREATTVFSAASIPGHRNKRIRDCLNAPLKNQQGNVDCLFFCVENSGSKFYVLKVSNLRTFFSTRKIEAYQASFRLFHNNFNYC